MTPTDLDDRLVALGDHLDAERAARSEPLPTVVPSGARHWLLVTAAIVLLIGPLAALVVGVLRDDTTEIAAGAPECPPPVSAVDVTDLPEPGSVLPTIADPPAWFGPPAGARRAGGQREGRWVSSVVGRSDGDLITAPIWIGATDGTLQGFDDAVPVTVDGARYRRLTFEAWEVLATVTEPLVVVSGTVEVQVLAEVLSEARADVDGAQVSVGPGPVLEGYCTLVDSQVHGPDLVGRRTLASTRSHTGVHEISDWGDPLLAALAGGADVTRVAIGIGEGWTGLAPGYDGILRFLTWSPEPGVVFQIATDDPARTLDELIDLAERVTPVDAEVWLDRYGP